MLRKKCIIVALAVVSVLVGSLFYNTITQAQEQPEYDPVADVNKDGRVNIVDIVYVAIHFGSTFVLPSEPNKTVVTVLSLDKEPPEVENARVAIIDPSFPVPYYRDAIEANYTDSSGIVSFELGSNKNYTAIAWSGSAYNYANFTTNSLGEASVLIVLGEPSLPPVRALPQGWVVVTLLNNETGTLYFHEEMYMSVERIIRYEHAESERRFISERVGGLLTDGGAVVLSPDFLLNEPHSRWGIALYDGTGELIGFGVYSPDKSGCANVILYVTPP